MKTSIAYSLVVAMIPFLLQAQGLKSTMENYFNNIRKGSYAEVPSELIKFENGEGILDLLQHYLRDSIQAVRKKAYEVTHFVSASSDSPSLRAKGVTILINACTENDPEIKRTSMQLLTGFERMDFNIAAKDSLRTLVKNQGLYLDRLIKLVGFLELSDLIPHIITFSQPGNPTQVRWAAMISLARMGQKPFIVAVMNRVKKLPVNDDLVYKIFPDLIYTRQPEPLEYIVEILQSDAKNCTAADAERDMPILCGYRIMELLAPVIHAYPLQLDNSGDAITEDYSRTLERVRHWFQINKTYKILNNKY